MKEFDFDASNINEFDGIIKKSKGLKMGLELEVQISILMHIT